MYLAHEKPELSKSISGKHKYSFSKKNAMDCIWAMGFARAIPESNSSKFTETQFSHLQNGQIGGLGNAHFCSK